MPIACKLPRPRPFHRATSSGLSSELLQTQMDTKEHLEHDHAHRPSGVYISQPHVQMRQPPSSSPFGVKLPGILLGSPPATPPLLLAAFPHHAAHVCQGFTRTRLNYSQNLSPFVHSKSQELYSTRQVHKQFPQFPIP